MSPRTARSAAPVPPTEAELRSLLGPCYSVLETFLARNADLRPEWKYYGPKNGWSLKLFHRKRNMCFISPREGELLIAFLLGARAVEAALDAGLPGAVEAEIRGARAYVEGLPVRLGVRTAADLPPAQTLLEIKKAG